MAWIGCFNMLELPRERLFDRFKSLKIPNDMVWAIYSLYEQVSRCVHCPGGLSNCFTRTIGVKGGESIVDYLMESPSLIPEIKE